MCLSVFLGWYSVSLLKCNYYKITANLTVCCTPLLKCLCGFLSELHLYQFAFLMYTFQQQVSILFCCLDDCCSQEVHNFRPWAAQHRLHTDQWHDDRSVHTRTNKIQIQTQKIKTFCVFLWLIYWESSPASQCQPADCWLPGGTGEDWASRCPALL